MTRLRLNWVSQLCVLATAIACGSSNKNDGGVGANNVGAVGGANALALGGSGYLNGGTYGSDGGLGNGGLNNNGGMNNTGVAGDGTAGSNSQAGNGSGTGSTGSTNGGEGTGDGGAGGNGSMATGGALTVDVKATGGSGSSVDVGATGGSGSSVDVATGGGWSIDIATGGGNSIDIATGGGNSIDIATGGGNSIDKATGGGSSIDLGTGGGTSIDHGCFVTTLGDINVYAIKDATPTGADTEGKLYVGGNLTASGYSVGAKATVDCTKYSLVVGGNVSLSGGSVRAGKASYAGTSGTASATNFDCGGLTRGKPIDFTALEAEVEDLSLKLSKLPVTDCTVSATGGVTITATNPKFSVCSIDAAKLTGSSVVNLNFPAGSSVAVNVSGLTANWAGAAVCLNGQCADSAQANQVVWNFYEATSLTASGIAIEGSVLAPLATLGGGGGHIAGQVIVKYLTGGLEYHPYMFSGCIKWPTSL